MKGIWRMRRWWRVANLDLVGRRTMMNKMNIPSLGNGGFLMYMN